MLDQIQAKLQGTQIADDWAEQLLSTVEELGMLPPTVYLKEFNALDNSWEPEDELQKTSV